MEEDYAMANKNIRSLKVYEISDYKYRMLPVIRFGGKWLGTAGFEVGDYITVRCGDGKIIIEPDRKRARMLEAERDFMEKRWKLCRNGLSLKRKGFICNIWRSRKRGMVYEDRKSRRVLRYRSGR